MLIIYIDIVLLVTLMILSIATCGYCFHRIYRLRQSGQLALLLRPRKVVFSHQQNGGATEELRSVVAYQNPFTGDYCVHKSRVTPTGYMNHLDEVSTHDSTDSGLSDEYEPCLDPTSTQLIKVNEPTKQVPAITWNEDSVNRPRNWNYNEYQI